MPLRTPVTREADRLRLAEMYIQGHSLAHMAAAFKISISQVHADVTKIHEEWKAEVLQDYDAKIAIELQKINKIEKEAWKGWERSCKDAERSHTKKKRVKKPGQSKGIGRLSVVEQTTTSTGQAGNVGFLSIVDNCIDRRCKILGLYAPAKVAPVRLDENGEWRPSEQEKQEVLEYAFGRAGIKLLPDQSHPTGESQSNGQSHTS